MLTGQNTTISGNLSGLVDKAGAKIASAIQNASAKTGVDFSYLLQQAKIESSFKADAKASTSSATGLYQFLDKTWLSMVDKHGDKYGLSDITNKKQILDLRKNPEICSLMAAEFASDNKDYLEKCTGKSVGSTELYMAHFMGANGASKFLNAMDKNPNETGATLFPDAARANKNVFYDGAGKPRSLEQVYAFFDKKFEIKSDTIGCAISTNNTLHTPPPADDSATANVLAAMALQGAPQGIQQRNAPLYSNTSSLYSNSDAPMDTGGTSNLPRSLFSMLSPIDVLELLKDQFTGHKANT